MDARELARSAGLFAWGILRRFYLWAFAFLLDPFDLYDRMIKPFLPSAYQVDLEMPSKLFPWFLGGGITWAGVMTYHELRRQAEKDRASLKAALESEEQPYLKVSYDDDRKLLITNVGGKNVWVCGLSFAGEQAIKDRVLLVPTAHCRPRIPNFLPHLLGLLRETEVVRVALDISLVNSKGMRFLQRCEVVASKGFGPIIHVRTLDLIPIDGVSAN